jgi:hypothetical protein
VGSYAWLGVVDFFVDGLACEGALTCGAAARGVVWAVSSFSWRSIFFSFLLAFRAFGDSFSTGAVDRISPLNNFSFSLKNCLAVLALKLIFLHSWVFTGPYYSSPVVLSGETSDVPAAVSD